MTIPLYQVDAFAERPFAGNSAGVCLLPDSADPQWMADLAMEMNLSETAYVVRRDDGGFDLRWFTPGAEADLCGHATLASAHAMWEAGWLKPTETAVFETRSGTLRAVQTEAGIELDFPANPPCQCDPLPNLIEVLGVENVVNITKSDLYWLIELASPDDVLAGSPDFKALGAMDGVEVIITSQGHSGEYDFISRFFAPCVGVDEDPVTGSAHCILGPYWGEKLGRTELTGYQASRRGGLVRVRLDGDRVKLTGNAITIFRAELTSEAAGAWRGAPALASQ